MLVIKDDELHTDIHRLPGVTSAPVCSYMYERKFGRSLTACNLQEVCTCTSVLPRREGFYRVMSVGEASKRHACTGHRAP